MAEPLRVGVMVSGGGSNLQSILDACEAGRTGARVVVVTSNRASAFGLERARNHGLATAHIPVGQTGSSEWEAADARQVEVLREHGVQLLCLAGYMRKTGPRLLAAFPNAIMNIHPALLPAFPGVDVQATARDYGVRIAGCTVHFADAEFDSGPIIIQAAVPVLPDDTGDDLAHRILAQEHRIYPQAIKWFAEGRLRLDGRIVRVKGAPPPLLDGALVCPGLDM
jgi:phosphoribosylglycinamide formyltransferase 1